MCQRRVSRYSPFREAAHTDGHAGCRSSPSFSHHCLCLPVCQNLLPFRSSLLSLSFDPLASTSHSILRCVCVPWPYHRVCEDMKEGGVREAKRGKRQRGSFLILVTRCVLARREACGCVCSKGEPGYTRIVMG